MISSSSKEPSALQGRQHIEQLQKEHYDQIARQYARHFENEYAEQYRRSIVELAFAGMDLKGKKVLDALCGGGELSSYFVERGAEVVGLDISETFCRIYGERFGRDKAICASVLQTGFADNSFDVVVAAGLHHLHPHVTEGVGELARVLKPGGLFFYWEPVAGTLFNAVRRVWYKFDRKYIKENEAAIDVDGLTESLSPSLREIKRIYVGNLAHLFVLQTMALRIPLGLLRFYAPAFISLEKILNRLQLKWFSCNVVGLMTKR